MENLFSLIDVLRSDVPGLQAVYIFGSSARGEDRAESDVDIAFLSTELMPPVKQFELQGMCSQAVGRTVDLVELRRADPVLRCEVIGGGKIIYAADQDAVAEFETVSMSMHCAFNEEIRELVSDIVARGSVYGR